MMNKAERHAWLSELQASQLKALCHVAGLYEIASDWDRYKMINNLCLVEGIENPKETS